MSIPGNLLENFKFKVKFNILTEKRSNKQYAINIKLVEQNTEYGYITVLKDNYGFIEMISQSKDIFFHYRLIINSTSLFMDLLTSFLFSHYSSTQTPAHQLDIGNEVKFNLRKNSNKISAENVCKLQNGTIQTHVCLDSTSYRLFRFCLLI